MKTIFSVIDKLFMYQSEKEAFVKSSVNSCFGNGGSACRYLAGTTITSPWTALMRFQYNGGHFHHLKVKLC